MAEYIDKEAAYQTLTEFYHHATEIQHEALREALAKVPAADVREVRRGRWEPNKKYPGWPGLSVCSVCQDCYIDTAWAKGSKHKWRFCPTCGAEMERANGKEKNEGDSE